MTDIPLIVYKIYMRHVSNYLLFTNNYCLKVFSMQLKPTAKWESSHAYYLQSMFRRYHIPPLERIIVKPNNKEAKKLLEQARTLKRALAVSIPFASIEDPHTYQQTLRNKIQLALPDFNAANQHRFSGHKTSELNQFLNNLGEGQHCVHLPMNAQIEVDEALHLPANILIDGHDSQLVANPPMTPACVVINHHHVGLINIDIQTHGLGILLQNTRHAILRNLYISQCERGIAILENAEFIELASLYIQQPAGGILIQGNVSHVWLHDSYILAGKRADNGGAGLLITDTSLKHNIEQHSWGGSLTEPLWPIEHPAPHALLIENNNLSGHVSQGIYIDGGYGIVVANNLITDNDKEGICLDFGAVNNLVMENNFVSNGWRARQSDESLRADLVLGFGKLADGSAVSKLPAISLDNAAQNVVIWNVIREGAGDGIKIVRTGVRNFLMFNMIADNNKGESNRLHFSGILLGGTQLEEEIDPTDHPLDFLPSLENLVASNIIYGPHFMGILLDKGATFNDIYDNMVRHFRRLPFAQASRGLHNSIIGNSWQLRKKNITIALIGLFCLAAGYLLAHSGF
jgi:parallel beta-helix repeat protein